MLKAYTSHHQNTSQRQGASVRIIISPDTTTHAVSEVETTNSGELRSFIISHNLTDVPLEASEFLAKKEHPQKSYEIVNFMRPLMKDFLAKYHPKVPVKLDSFPDSLPGSHVLRVDMPANDRTAWLDLLGLVEPVQEQNFAELGVPTLYAFKINTPFKIEPEEYNLTYKLKNLWAQLTNSLPFEWVSEKDLEKYDTILKIRNIIIEKLYPTGFKAVHDASTRF